MYVLIYEGLCINVAIAYRLRIHCRPTGVLRTKYDNWYNVFRYVGPIVENCWFLLYLVAMLHLWLTCGSFYFKYNFLLHLVSFWLYCTKNFLFCFYDRNFLWFRKCPRNTFFCKTKTKKNNLCENQELLWSWVIYIITLWCLGCIFYFIFILYILSQVF